MIRVVVDTNVLISGTFWSGSSFQVLKLVDSASITLIVSPAILQEYDELLHREEIMDKHAYSIARAQSAIKILAKAVLVEPQISIKAAIDDRDDDKFIEAAIAGKTDYIISKDKKHLLPLKDFRGIKIVTPEEFLKLIK